MGFLNDNSATQIMNKLVILVCFRSQNARPIVRFVKFRSKNQLKIQIATKTIVAQLRVRKRHSQSYNFDLISTQKVSQEGFLAGIEF